MRRRIGFMDVGILYRESCRARRKGLAEGHVPCDVRIACRRRPARIALLVNIERCRARVFPAKVEAARHLPAAVNNHKRALNLAGRYCRRTAIKFKIRRRRDRNCRSSLLCRHRIARSRPEIIAGTEIRTGQLHAGNYAVSANGTFIVCKFHFYRPAQVVHRVEGQKFHLREVRPIGQFHVHKRILHRDCPLRDRKFGKFHGHIRARCGSLAARRFFHAARRFRTAGRFLAARGFFGRTGFGNLARRRFRLLARQWLFRRT